jgi:hypothetical protein
MIASMSAYAAYKGFTRGYVWQMKEQGKIVMVGQGGKTLVDFEASDRLLESVANPDKQHTVEYNKWKRSLKGSGPESEPEDESDYGANQNTLTRARAEEKQLDVQIKRVEYHKLIGEVAEVSDMVQAVLDCVGVAAAAIEGLADRLAPQVSGEPDAHKVYESIRGESIRLREELQRSTIALIEKRMAEQEA